MMTVVTMVAKPKMPLIAGWWHQRTSAVLKRSFQLLWWWRGTCGFGG